MMQFFSLLIKNPRLTDPKYFANIFSDNGIDPKKFDQMISSFGIISKVSQAQRRIQKNYKIQGTPEIIVNGKYRISSKMAGSQSEMLQVADFLINLERRKRSDQILKFIPLILRFIFISNNRSLVYTFLYYR